DDTDELVDKAVVGQQRHVLVTAAHGDNISRAFTPHAKNRRGPMPTPRWHQPCRRILADATPCEISTRRSIATCAEVRRGRTSEKRVTPTKFGLAWRAERFS